jgi:hypothetical protein
VTNDECIHGLGPIAACTICNGRERRERAERDRIVARWTALYNGTCAMCGGAISPGYPMGRTADDRYVCEDHL